MLQIRPGTLKMEAASFVRLLKTIVDHKFPWYELYFLSSGLFVVHLDCSLEIYARLVLSVPSFTSYSCLLKIIFIASDRGQLLVFYLTIAREE